MWCVSALAICCASSEIKRVIVMVQLYCWVFTFIVFAGSGWLALVPAHLPHLRLLCLERCDRVCDKYIEELVAAVPKLVVINHLGDIVGEMRNKQLESSDECFSVDAYTTVRQWALDR
jgi:hypothetical protein